MREYESLLQPLVYEGRLNAAGFRFAVVASRWNDFISSRLLEGALDALERLGAEEKAVSVLDPEQASSREVLADALN